MVKPNNLNTVSVQSLKPRKSILNINNINNTSNNYNVYISNFNGNLNSISTLNKEKSSKETVSFYSTIKDKENNSLITSNKEDISKKDDKHHSGLKFRNVKSIVPNKLPHDKFDFNTINNDKNISPIKKTINSASKRDCFNTIDTTNNILESLNKIDTNNKNEDKRVIPIKLKFSNSLIDDDHYDKLVNDYINKQIDTKELPSKFDVDEFKDYLFDFFQIEKRLKTKLVTDTSIKNNIIDCKANNSVITSVTNNEDNDTFIDLNKDDDIFPIREDTNDLNYPYSESNKIFKDKKNVISTFNSNFPDSNKKNDSLYTDDSLDNYVLPNKHKEINKKILQSQQSMICKSTNSNEKYDIPELEQKFKFNSQKINQHIRNINQPQQTTTEEFSETNVPYNSISNYYSNKNNTIKHNSGILGNNKAMRILDFTKNKKVTISLKKNPLINDSNRNINDLSILTSPNPVNLKNNNNQIHHNTVKTSNSHLSHLLYKQHGTNSSKIGFNNISNISQNRRKSNLDTLAFSSRLSAINKNNQNLITNNSISISNSKNNSKNLINANSIDYNNTNTINKNNSNGSSITKENNFNTINSIDDEQYKKNIELIFGKKKPTARVSFKYNNIPKSNTKQSTVNSIRSLNSKINNLEGVSLTEKNRELLSFLLQNNIKRNKNLSSIDNEMVEKNNSKTPAFDINNLARNFYNQKIKENYNKTVIVETQPKATVKKISNKSNVTSCLDKSIISNNIDHSFHVNSQLENLNQEIYIRNRVKNMINDVIDNYIDDDLIKENKKLNLLKKENTNIQLVQVRKEKSILELYEKESKASNVINKNDYISKLSNIIINNENKGNETISLHLNKRNIKNIKFDSEKKVLHLQNFDLKLDYKKVDSNNEFQLPMKNKLERKKSLEVANSNALMRNKNENSSFNIFKKLLAKKVKRLENINEDDINSVNKSLSKNDFVSINNVIRQTQFYDIINNFDSNNKEIKKDGEKAKQNNNLQRKGSDPIKETVDPLIESTNTIKRIINNNALEFDSYINNKNFFKLKNRMTNDLKTSCNKVIEKKVIKEVIYYYKNKLPEVYNKYYMTLGLSNKKNNSNNINNNGINSNNAYCFTNKQSFLNTQDRIHHFLDEEDELGIISNHQEKDSNKIDLFNIKNSTNKSIKINPNTKLSRTNTISTSLIKTNDNILNLIEENINLTKTKYRTATKMSTIKESEVNFELKFKQNTSDSKTDNETCNLVKKPTQRPKLSTIKLTNNYSNKLANINNSHAHDDLEIQKYNTSIPSNDFFFDINCFKDKIIEPLNFIDLDKKNLKLLKQEYQECIDKFRNKASSNEVSKDEKVKNNSMKQFLYSKFYSSNNNTQNLRNTRYTSSVKQDRINIQELLNNSIKDKIKSKKSNKIFDIINESNDKELEESRLSSIEGSDNSDNNNNKITEVDENFKEIEINIENAQEFKDENDEKDNRNNNLINFKTSNELFKFYFNMNKFNINIKLLSKYFSKYFDVSYKTNFFETNFMKKKNTNSDGSLAGDNITTNSNFSYNKHYEKKRNNLTLSVGNHFFTKEVNPDYLNNKEINVDQFIGMHSYINYNNLNHMALVNRDIGNLFEELQKANLLNEQRELKNRVQTLVNNRRLTNTASIRLDADKISILKERMGNYNNYNDVRKDNSNTNNLYYLGNNIADKSFTINKTVSNQTLNQPPFSNNDNQSIRTMTNRGNKENQIEVTLTKVASDKDSCLIIENDQNIIINDDNEKLDLVRNKHNSIMFTKPIIMVKNFLLTEEEKVTKRRYTINSVIKPKLSNNMIFNKDKINAISNEDGFSSELYKHIFKDDEYYDKGLEEMSLKEESNIMNPNLSVKFTNDSFNLCKKELVKTSFFKSSPSIKRQQTSSNYFDNPIKSEYTDNSERKISTSTNNNDLNIAGNKPRSSFFNNNINLINNLQIINSKNKDDTKDKPVSMINFKEAQYKAKMKHVKKEEESNESDPEENDQFNYMRISNIRKQTRSVLNQKQKKSSKIIPPKINSKVKLFGRVMRKPFKVESSHKQQIEEVKEHLLNLYNRKCNLEQYDNNPEYFENDLLFNSDNEKKISIIKSRANFFDSALNNTKKEFLRQCRKKRNFDDKLKLNNTSTIVNTMTFHEKVQAKTSDIKRENLIKSDLSSRLFYYIWDQNTEGFKLEFEVYNPSPDLVNNDSSRSLLMDAVLAENYILVNYLIEKGVDINMNDKFGNTALHHACVTRNFNIIDLLVKKKAYQFLRNNRNQTCWEILSSTKI